MDLDIRKSHKSFQDMSVKRSNLFKKNKSYQSYHTDFLLKIYLRYIWKLSYWDVLMEAFILSLRSMSRNKQKVASMYLHIHLLSLAKYTIEHICSSR